MFRQFITDPRLLRACLIQSETPTTSSGALYNDAYFNMKIYDTECRQKHNNEQRDNNERKDL